MAETCKYCRRPVRVSGSLFVRGGLCRVCYMDGELRSRFAVQLPPEVIPPVPEFPTFHLPGTTGKIEVMIARRRDGRQLFHPYDNTPWIDEQEYRYDW